MLKRTSCLVIAGLAAMGGLAQHGCAPIDGTSCEDELTCPSPDAGVDGGGVVTTDATADTTVPAEDGGAEAGNEPDSPVVTEDAGVDSAPTCAFTTCGGDAGCVDTQTSVDNCGTCGHACDGGVNGGATCTGGTCGVGCNAGFANCGGTCVNEQTDPSHCGSCSKVCAAPTNGTATCASATCGTSCGDAGAELCGTACVSPDDPAHCGPGCNVCPAPASGNGSGTCATGTCALTCNTGYVLCNGDCHSESAAPTDACVVTDPLAVFVAPTGADGTAGGTMEAPYATIGYALQNPKGRSRVYVCAGTYAGAVSLTASTPAVSVYGGFNCSSWVYTAATPSLVNVAPPAGTIPLTMNAVTSAVTITNMTFTAASVTGTDANGNGLSSIAAFATGTTSVTLKGGGRLRRGTLSGGRWEGRRRRIIRGAVAAGGGEPDGPRCGGDARWREQQVLEWQHVIRWIRWRVLPGAVRRLAGVVESGRGDKRDV